MKKDILKETMIEFCENYYALAAFKLNDNNNLKELIDKLVSLEDKIRICDEEKELIDYKMKLDLLIKEIEVVINAR